MQSNSSSIEAVFSSVRNAGRDTPQGFVMAASVSSSMDGIALLSVQQKRTYDALDIPDESSPTRTNILERNDRGRERALLLCSQSYVEKNVAQSVLFGSLGVSKLSNGFANLKVYLEAESRAHLREK